MRPANFPGNKNKRRQRALERLLRQLRMGPQSGPEWERTKAEISRLRTLIVPYPQARSVRTKKRGGHQVGRPLSDL